MTPDIREKAERLTAAHRNYANDRGGFADLISQALLEAHNAGRAEMREEAAKLADRHRISRRGEMRTYGIDLATAIRSIT